jgi:hypothetical protein
MKEKFMIGTVRLTGGDAITTNTSGSHWIPLVSPVKVPCVLYKVVIYVPSTATADPFIWIFDGNTSGGGTLTTDPVTVLACPKGLTTTLDFGAGGKLFQYGLSIAVASAEPTDPTTAWSSAGNDQARVAADYRVK